MTTMSSNHFPRHLVAVLLFLSKARIIQGFAPPTKTTIQSHNRISKSQQLFSTAETTSTTNIEPVLKSNLLGPVTPLQLESDDDGFVAKMGVPTFLAPGGHLASEIQKDAQHHKVYSAGLEGILNQGPALMVHNVLSPRICHELIQDLESLGFGSFQAGKNNHGALQLLVSDAIQKAVAAKLAPHINVEHVQDLLQEMERATDNNSNSSQDNDIRLTLCGLNRRWRIYRYAPGGEETFSPHIDAGFPPSSVSENGALIWDSSGDQDIVSRLTVLIYLNDDFEGGETNFYFPSTEKVLASVKPRTGSVLLFPQAVGEDAVDYARKHWPLHEGAPVENGSPKYVIRSDVLFHTAKEPLPLEDPLSCYDHLVRETFQTRSAVLDDKFLSHVLPLYNPHMGVENLGPLLYSLIRFTKVQNVVEIGAGYTSVWILQALKDNDEEMSRIADLNQAGQNRLLDIEWNVPVHHRPHDKKPSLLCIDNCLHQKETASGAAAVAQTLGLGEYFEFLQGDAYQLELEPESIDLLWCDFGVGSRMAEFVPGAWKSLRPGGFLLCHSTVTNQGTRDWLEALRRQEGESVTGIPAGEYLEISLWEPHKRYQNSVSLIQKRRDSTGEAFSEPIHSQYA